MTEAIHEVEDGQFDEYLWPLTSASWPLNWRRVTDSCRIRHRLSEILQHVQESHVMPRVRRARVTHSSAIAQITQRVISGPLDGAFWERTLLEPVPRALRDEWSALAAELRELSGTEPKRNDRRASAGRGDLGRHAAGHFNQ
ncbi:MAG TPA: hypothetical protein VMW17_05665 [Candidatus Binatia bacterium]|nr:hypothetical protein [Candidatus Binatia bacterium]